MAIDLRTVIPRVNGACNVRTLPLGPQEGFVLSRVDGLTSAADIGAMTGLGEDVFAVLLKLASLGALLDVPGATPAPPPAPAPVAPSPPPPAPRKRRSGPPKYTQAELDEACDLDVDRRRRILETFYALPELSHYDLLEVERSADKKAVKAAYYKLAPEFHPDKFFRKELGAFKPKMEAIFRAVTEAEQVLSRKASREEYDAYLEQRERTAEIEALLKGEEPPADELIEEPPSAPPPEQPPPAPTTSSRQWPAEAASQSRLPVRPASAITPQPPPRAPTISQHGGAPHAGAMSQPGLPPRAPTSSQQGLPPRAPTGSQQGLPPRAPTASGSQQGLPPRSLTGSQQGAPARPATGSQQGLPPRATSGSQQGAAPHTGSTSSQPPRSADDERARRQQLAAKLVSGGSGRFSQRPVRAGSEQTPVPPGETPAETAARHAAASDNLRRMMTAKKVEEAREHMARYTKSAEEAVARGDTVAAANAYRLAASRDPGDVALAQKSQDWSARAAKVLAAGYLKQGEYEARDGRWAEAARSLVKAVAGMDDDAKVLHLTAQALLKGGGDLHQAAELAKRALVIHPESITFHVMLAEIYLAANMPLAAKRTLEGAAKLDPKDSKVRALLERVR